MYTDTEMQRLIQRAIEENRHAFIAKDALCPAPSGYWDKQDFKKLVQTLDYIAENASGLFLEMGSGIGHVGFMARKRGFDVVQVENNPDMYSLLERYAEEYETDTTRIQGNMIDPKMYQGNGIDLNKAAVVYVYPSNVSNYTDTVYFIHQHLPSGVLVALKNPGISTRPPNSFIPLQEFPSFHKTTIYRME